MPTLDKNDKIKLNSEKKSYREPQLKEIGRINSITKGLWFGNTDMGGFSGNIQS